MDLIIAAAGKSSRFPNTRPKWLLTHPRGDLMVTASIRGLPVNEFEMIHLVVLKEHLEKYQCEGGIKDAFDMMGIRDKLNLVVLDEPTRNQPETVSACLQKTQRQTSFFIKDADNYFESNFIEPNSISTYNLMNMNSVNASNKSYVEKNEKGLVTNIIEKQVISSEFCCGGYSFASPEQFLKNFNEIKHHDNLYLSHVIFQMILNGVSFTTMPVREYSDWGTQTDWNEYKSKFGTYFIDIDGLLVENSGRFFEPFWGTTEAIQENVDLINKLYYSGKSQIILTTSRSHNHSIPTVNQLKRIGMQYHQIVYDLMHCKRTIINDYAATNAYPSCAAININRDSRTELTTKLAGV